MRLLRRKSPLLTIFSSISFANPRPSTCSSHASVDISPNHLHPPHSTAQALLSQSSLRFSILSRHRIQAVIMSS
ncbi:hypothetical protein EMPG_15129 [Blastomyces silverae]|uniref:Uncharacterized protein n=1 Tax=Blastomyces silverae TaxID=2060906 RepID=A0A0H1BEK7_9EURO|nr:hypothetical protein EMPG_15129 [Blastomyces silverae]